VFVCQAGRQAQTRNPAEWDSEKDEAGQCGGVSWWDATYSSHYEVKESGFV